MISVLIYYLMGGVAFNFCYDLLVSHAGNEEWRFTMRERLITLAVWPIYALVFIFNFLRNLW